MATVQNLSYDVTNLTCSSQNLY